MTSIPPGIGCDCGVAMTCTHTSLADLCLRTNDKVLSHGPVAWRRWLNGPHMASLLVDLVCRPPRNYYELEDLGPRAFVVGGVFCVREDLTLVNRSSMQIHCRCPSWCVLPPDAVHVLTSKTPLRSHYFPASKRTGRALHAVPTVVYLHGNSGCRLEGNDIADGFLRRGMAFVCVDFGGCGISDGGMVTLGLREREDVEVVLDFLKSHAAVSHVALYGRSMGAATSLLVAADDRFYHSVKGQVLDSCYVSVREIAEDLAHRYSGLGLVATTAVDALREAVANKAGFDIDTIDVLRAAPLCQCPALFGHADQDKLVGRSHTERIFEEYGRIYHHTCKDIAIFEGDHNSARPSEWCLRAVDFLEGCFQAAEIESSARKWFIPNFFRRRPASWRPAGDSSGAVDHSKGSAQDYERQMLTPMLTDPSTCGEYLWSPSSRAIPSRIGHEDYCAWLVHQRAHTDNLDRANGRAPTHAVLSHTTSPVERLLDFFGADVGARSSQMTPCLPPRHRANAAVYESSQSSLILRESPHRIITSSASTTSGTDTKLAADRMENISHAVCKYCGASGQVVQVQMPGPWHVRCCERWVEIPSPINDAAKSQESYGVRRLGNRAAPCGPPLGPVDKSESTGSGDDVIHGARGGARVAWVINEESWDESEGTVGVLGMIFLLICLVIASLCDHVVPQLDALCRYR